MKPTDEEVGGAVLAARRSSGMSQIELAHIMRQRGCTITQSALSKVERGARPLFFAEAWVLAEVCGFRLHPTDRPSAQPKADIQIGVQIGMQRAVDALNKMMEKL